MAPKQDVAVKLIKAVTSVATKSCQFKLLKSVIESEDLIRSKIISSIQPTIGREFKFNDIQSKAEEILIACRKRLLNLSVTEVHRDFINDTNTLNCKLKKFLENQDVILSEAENIVNYHAAKTHHIVNKRHEKKTVFHLKGKPKLPSEKFVKPKQVKRQDHVLRKTQNKSIRKKKYLSNLKKRKAESLSKTIENIKKSNIVVNLSKSEVSDLAYIYLAHGLNYVESKVV